MSMFYRILVSLGILCWASVIGPMFIYHSHVRNVTDVSWGGIGLVILYVIGMIGWLQPWSREWKW